MTAEATVAASDASLPLEDASAETRFATSIVLRVNYEQDAKFDQYYITRTRPCLALPLPILMR